MPSIEQDVFHSPAARYGGRQTPERRPVRPRAHRWSGPAHPLLRVLALLAVPSCLAGQGTDDGLGADVARDTAAVQADADADGETGVTVDSALQAPNAPEAISAQRSSQDEMVRSRLQALFDRVASLSDLTVEVEAGVVRLTGSVADSRAEERAEALAEEQDGVLYVESDISLTTSLGERLRPTWSRLRDLVYDTIATLPLLAVALAIVLLAGLVGRVLGRWGGPSFLAVRNPFLQGIIARAIQAAVLVAGLLLALDLLEATALVGAVVGTAGLAGLAVGFAFKDIVENYLAGVLLALRQPFDLNDHVVVDAHEGKIVRLTPRETILMTLEGNHVRLPNALVFRSPLLNYTRNPRRRFSFDAGIGPVDDLALARDTGKAVLGAMEGVMADPAPEALVTELGDSWVTVRFQAWVDQRQADFGRVRSEAIRLVKLRLEEAGISLPSPEYVVQLREADGASHGPPPATSPDRAEGTQADVSVDRSVDRQIDEEREASQEENLLEGG